MQKASISSLLQTAVRHWIKLEQFDSKGKSAAHSTIIERRQSILRWRWSACSFSCLSSSSPWCFPEKLLPVKVAARSLSQQVRKTTAPRMVLRKNLFKVDKPDEWASWTSWGPCSQSCSESPEGSGFRRRSRECESAGPAISESDPSRLVEYTLF